MTHHEEDVQSRQRMIGSYLLAGVIGAAVGALIGLLFAPKPGRELRGDVASAAVTAKGKAAQAGSKIAEQAGVLGRRTRELAERVKLRAHDVESDVAEAPASGDDGAQG
jgi:gas vesicle protein